MLFVEGSTREVLADMAERSVDVIIVLGQSLNPDGSAARTLVNRLQTAARCHHELTVPIVCTGGDPAGTGITEAQSMARLLHAHVSPHSVLLEDKSNTTFENAKFCLDMLRPRGWSKWALVTSDFHLPRALVIFESVCGPDVTLVGVAAPHGCPANETVDNPQKQMNQLTFSERVAHELQLVSRMRASHWQQSQSMAKALKCVQVPWTDARLDLAVQQLNTLLSQDSARARDRDPAAVDPAVDSKQPCARVDVPMPDAASASAPAP